MVDASRLRAPVPQKTRGVEELMHVKFDTSVLPQNWCGNEPSRTITCMVLKAKANDMAEVEENVDLSKSMNSNSDAEIDIESTIETVKFSKALHCLETVKLFLMQ
ncbi:hypothetical protein TNCV_3583911 [Trichonephila clavipes]|nr:hypothetical protein TNCV_3583911 [Trichonephila clavipes]